MNDILKMGLRTALTICLFLAPLERAHAEGTPAPKKITAVEGVTEYLLDNGARVLLYPDKSSSKVTVNMTLLVGSRHEGYGETGMAHLLEHMLFKGTPTYPNSWKSLRDHGADCNGITTTDRTYYYETMNASDANLEFGIRFEADRLVNSFIKREDLASEMTVVRNEFEMGENNPAHILQLRMSEAAYDWHNYGKPVIGNRSDIERVPIEHLQAFYKKYYQPDNIVLIVAGNFDENRTLELVGKYLGVLKRPLRQLEATYTDEPNQDGERQIVLRRTGGVGNVGLMYHVPAAAHPDFAALEVLDSILGGANGRLYNALVKTGKASQVASSCLPSHDPGVMQFAASFDRGTAPEQIRDAMFDVVEGVHKTPITTEEVDRVKRATASVWNHLANQPSTMAAVLSMCAALGDWRLLFLDRDRMEKVTPEDVARVAQKYLKQSNRTVGLFIPTDKPDQAIIPETPSLAESLKDYKGREAVADGDAFDATPQNIEKFVQRSVLPSGVKIALLPKKSRGEMVVVKMVLRFGNPESLKGKDAAAQLLGAMLLHGTRSYNRQQINDEADRLQAAITCNSSAGNLTLAIQCKRTALPEVLKLVREVLREPSFTAEEFEILKNQRVQTAEAGLKEPDQLGPITLLRAMQPLPKDDSNYVPTLEESLARWRELKLEQVKKLYAEQLGAEVGEIAVVGDFDGPATTRLLTDMLKDWKASVPYRRIEESPAKAVGGRHVILTPDKANAMYLAGHVFTMRDDDADYPALRLASFIFGETEVASRLSGRVRGKEGLSYNTVSQIAVGSRDRLSMFLLYAICNPLNMEKVDKVAAEELDRMIKNGVTEKEVEDAKKALLETYQAQRGTDAGLAIALANGLSLGTTYNTQAEFEKNISDLTAEQVSAAFRKYIDPKKLTIVEAGDLPKEVTVPK